MSFLHGGCPDHVYTPEEIALGIRYRCGGPPPPTKTASRTSASRKHASRTSRTRSVQETEELIRALYQEVDKLLDLSYSKTLEYYCTVENAAHRATLGALQRAQNVLARLHKLGAAGSPQYIHYQTELARARQYLRDKKKYIDLPDHGSLISGDGECNQFL